MVKKNYYSGSIKIEGNRKNANSSLYTLMGILIENGYSITANRQKDGYYIYYCKAVKNGGADNVE